VSIFSPQAVDADFPIEAVFRDLKVKYQRDSAVEMRKFCFVCHEIECSFHLVLSWLRTIFSQHFEAVICSSTANRKVRQPFVQWQRAVSALATSKLGLSFAFVVLPTNEQRTAVQQKKRL